MVRKSHFLKNQQKEHLITFIYEGERIKDEISAHLAINL